MIPNDGEGGGEHKSTSPGARKKTGLIKAKPPPQTLHRQEDLCNPKCCALECLSHALGIDYDSANFFTRIKNIVFIS